MCLECLRVTTLQHADGSELTLFNGNLLLVTEFFITPDTLFVGGNCLVEATQAGEVRRGLEQLGVGTRLGSGVSSDPGSSISARGLVPIT